MANGLVLRCKINEASAVSATGGNINFVGDYIVHEFTTNGTFTPNKSGTYEIFMVGAGGQGGYNLGYSQGFHGGGGGGEVISTTVSLTAGTNYSAVIGRFGASNTTFAGQTAVNGLQGTAARTKRS